MADILKEENTLAEKQSSLSTENDILQYVIYGEIILSGLLTLFGVYVLLTNKSYGVLGSGLVFLFLAVSHYVKRGENKNDIGKMRSGRSGETFVSDLLQEELPGGFYILNDLEVTDGTKTAQNDHIILSPGGLILIETKAYAGTLRGHADDENWTQSKKETTRQVTNPIQQNEYHRDVLCGFLEQKDLPFEKEDVHLFVAMVNKQCEWSIEGDADSVDYAWKLPDRIEKIGNRNTYEADEMKQFLRAVNLPIPDELQDHSSPGDSGSVNTEWWLYRNGNVSDQTYTTDELKRLDLDGTTKACPTDSDDWIPISEIDELR